MRVTWPPDSKRGTHDTISTTGHCSIEPYALASLELGATIDILQTKCLNSPPICLTTSMTRRTAATHHLQLRRLDWPLPEIRLRISRCPCRTKVHPLLPPELTGASTTCPFAHLAERKDTQCNL